VIRIGPGRGDGAFGGKSERRSTARRCWPSRGLHAPLWHVGKASHVRGSLARSDVFVDLRFAQLLQHRASQGFAQVQPRFADCGDHWRGFGDDAPTRLARAINFTIEGMTEADACIEPLGDDVRERFVEREIDADVRMGG
jgi:hypothetical protein